MRVASNSAGFATLDCGITDRVEHVLTVIYQWTVKHGFDAQFRAAWREMTLSLRESRGALGSRLHQSEPGKYVAYAQWPSRAVYDQAQAKESANPEAGKKMREAILLSQPAMFQELVDDLLVQRSVRIARATDDIDRLVRFYVSGLGFSVLGQFQDHAGFDGAMVGLHGQAWHLEFTKHKEGGVKRVPHEEDLVVIYFADHDEWQRTVTGIQARGVLPVLATNPYWNNGGLLFRDPDGFGVIYFDGAWVPDVSPRD